MKFEEVFKVLDADIFNKLQRHLKDVEKFVLWGAWQGQTYDEMADASSYRYTPSYLKQGVGPRLWKLVSEVLGEEVCKTNFRTAVERQVQLTETRQIQEFARVKFTKELPLLTSIIVEPAIARAASEMPSGLELDLLKPASESSKPSIVKWIDPHLIQLNAGTQSRKQFHQQTIDDYAQQIAEELWDWERQPLPIVFDDGQNLFPGDGHHRIMAAIAAGLSQILVEVFPGTVRDAIFYSTSANKFHGLPRSNVDKRNQVELLLSDREWQQMSDRAIASHCGVSAPFVGKIRAELVLQGTVNISSERIDQSGRKIQTANIGSKSNSEKTRTLVLEKPDRQPETSMAQTTPELILSAVPQQLNFLKKLQANEIEQVYQYWGAKKTALMALERCTQKELREIYEQLRQMIGNYI